MCIVSISSRYQITIPKEIRERFDIKPGDKALFFPRGKTIEVVFARSNEELEEMKRLYSKTSEFLDIVPVGENSESEPRSYPAKSPKNAFCTKWHIVPQVLCKMRQSFG
ncbi:MAG: AbrB/MazE/SpoVT family DNA-binding domain-containing protein [Thermoplasmata archaeon]|nr:AbrB/MazE/SpoVT family DNA-binding domain-containing protein [Thermoplasmata archaeon]